MKHPALLLFPILLSAGCKTVVTYDAKIDAGPAKPADYPIYIYTEKIDVPRPYEVIGQMHVGDTFLTTRGGSIEAEVKTLQQNARQKGADAVQLTSIEPPGFSSANYKVDANFLRFTDQWESASLSKEEVLAYFKNNEKTLDPIEGIWNGSDPIPHQIGIMKSTTKPGRNFVAFILETKNPSWKRGYKKMDITLGERAGVYRIDYYLDDFEKKGAVITFTAANAGQFVVRMADDVGFIFFQRN